MLWRTGLVTLVFVFGQVLAAVAVPVDSDYVSERVLRASMDSRIVSGWEAYPEQHPHHVNLRAFSAAGTVGIFGGALVSRQWIITSGRCTAVRTSIIARLGATNLTAPELTLFAQEWHTHPTFDGNLNTVQVNDIGMVKLPLRVSYTRYIQPIRVQSTEDAFRNYNNEVVFITGHGRLWTDGALPDILNWVFLRAISNEECALVYPRVVNENTICATAFNVSSQSPCAGDGGGPLVHVDSDGVPTLIGVHSFRSTSGCHVGIPTGFVRPGPFHSWFTEITRLNFEDLVDDEDEATTPIPDYTESTTYETESTVVPTTTEQQEDDDVSTTVVPTTTAQHEDSAVSTTVVPTTTAQHEDSAVSTTVVPTTAAQQEDNDESTTTAPITAEESESDEESDEEKDSDEDNDDSSVSESNERPSGSVIKKRKKMAMKVQFNFKAEKKIEVEKIRMKKKHPKTKRKMS